MRVYFKLEREMKLTEEHLSEIESLSEMTDEDIDFSDIPEITEE